MRNKKTAAKMPQLFVCVNFCICSTTYTNHPFTKNCGKSDTINAGLLTRTLKQMYFSLPNSSVTDFRHETHSQVHTAAVPFGIYTRFPFHHIYPLGIYDTSREFIQFPIRCPKTTCIKSMLSWFGI